VPQSKKDNNARGGHDLPIWRVTQNCSTPQKGNPFMSNSLSDAKTNVWATHKTALAACLAILGTTAFLIASTVTAQDAAKLDPKHYKVEFENDQVRVLRITYGPHEKSVMHSHPASVAVFLTDLNGKLTLPGGKSQVMVSKAGTVQWEEPTTHLPENTGDKGFELIQVELKTKPAAAK
jgi:quercetin dioxygenase-like cupin family protein